MTHAKKGLSVSEDKQGWEKDLEDVLKKQGVKGDEADKLANILESKSFRLKGTITPEEFLKSPGVKIATSFYPILYNCYMAVFASRAAAIEAGMPLEQADSLYANGVLSAQNEIIGAYLKLVRKNVGI